MPSKSFPLFPPLWRSQGSGAAYSSQSDFKPPSKSLARWASFAHTSNSLCMCGQSTALPLLLIHRALLFCPGPSLLLQLMASSCSHLRLSRSYRTHYPSLCPDLIHTIKSRPAVSHLGHPTAAQTHQAFISSRGRAPITPHSRCHLLVPTCAQASLPTSTSCLPLLPSDFDFFWRLFSRAFSAKIWGWLLFYLHLKLSSIPVFFQNYSLAETRTLFL